MGPHLPGRRAAYQRRPRHGAAKGGHGGHGIGERAVYLRGADVGPRQRGGVRLGRHSRLRGAVCPCGAADALVRQGGCGRLVRGSRAVCGDARRRPLRALAGPQAAA